MILQQQSSLKNGILMNWLNSGLRRIRCCIHIWKRHLEMLSTYNSSFEFLVSKCVTMKVMSILR